LIILVFLEIFWVYLKISRQTVSKKSIGLVIGSTMVAVEKRIWKLRAVISYEQQKKLKVEKSYFGIIIEIVFVRIAINGSTIILSWGLNIRSVLDAKIVRNRKSTA
jgi:hypothetical protein